ncbi:aldose 1-epimerase [soil metagenome]
MASAEPPPLAQVDYSDGPIEITVLPGLGARLHRLRVYGHDLLRTPPEVQEHLSDPFYWGGFVMAPWCNRLAAKPVSVAGQVIDLPANFRDGSAIHGQVYVRPWEVGTDGTLRVRGGGDGWPWPYEASLRVRLDKGTLRLEQSLRNLFDEPMPAGLGLHPWFRRPLHVAVRAQRVFVSNTDSAAQPQPVSGPHDLRRLAEMAPDLDATWAELTDPPVELTWPDLGLHATMSISAQTRFVTAASPDAVDAVAVEPQTHAPQGLRRLLNGEPGALALLAPDDALTLTTQITFERLPGEGDA